MSRSRRRSVFASLARSAEANIEAERVMAATSNRLHGKISGLMRKGPASPTDLVAGIDELVRRRG